MNKILYTIIGVVASSPFVTNAQVVTTEGRLTFFENMMNSIGKIVDIAMPAMVGLLFIAFVWGLITYVSGQRSGNTENQTSGKEIMIAGIIALFVVTSIWGIIRFMQGFIGISPTTIESGTLNVPKVERIPTR